MDPSAQLTVQGDLGNYVLFGHTVEPSPEEMATVLRVVLSRIHGDLDYITPQTPKELFPGAWFSPEELKTARCAVLADRQYRVPEEHRQLVFLVRRGVLVEARQLGDSIVGSFLETPELLTDTLKRHPALGLLIYAGLISNYRRILHERERRDRALACTLEHLDELGQRLGLPQH